MEVCDSVQETGIKTIPQKKKCKKAKWLSEEALCKAYLKIYLNNCEEKRSQKQRRKGKIHPFECRVPKNSQEKVFLSGQCKEIEENNRMGKTRDLFKKIRDTKGIFHVKMSTINDRGAMGLTEAEDIKKRCQEYTKELYKKRSS